MSRDNLVEFETKFKLYQDEKAEAEAKIGQFEEAIAAKETELKNSNEDPTPFKKDAETHRANITAKQLVDLNVILTKSSPAKLVEAMEALVGVLRDCNQATNIDVELFLKDPSKLLTKFKRMESHGLTYAYITKHKAELEACEDAFKRDDKNPGQDD